MYEFPPPPSNHHGEIIMTTKNLTMLLLATAITISPVKAGEVTENYKAGIGIAGLIAVNAVCEGSVSYDNKMLIDTMQNVMKDDSEYSRGFNDGTTAATIAIRIDRAVFCAAYNYKLESPENLP
jgi:hypothetical protein